MKISKRLLKLLANLSKITLLKIRYNKTLLEKATLLVIWWIKLRINIQNPNQIMGTAIHYHNLLLENNNKNKFNAYKKWRNNYTINNF